MENELSSVCPIFIRYSNGKSEQVGSGVLLQLENDIFLLTAGHVIDWMEQGTLCIPCNDGISSITGYISSIYAPMSIDRNDDKLDIAYFKLDDDLVTKIHKDFIPITRDECWVTDSSQESDIYSFSGFPLNKTKNRNGKISSEFFSYSGTAVDIETYKTLGYNLETNILVSFRRKKSMNSLGEKIIPPHPKGISGGAVFRWPKNIHRKKQKLKRYLVGIGHTYLSNKNLFIGTKLDVILKFISLRNPIVYKDADINFSPANRVPLFGGLAHYRREEWSLLKFQFEDAENMHNTWSEWREAAESGIEHMHRQGKIMIPIEISAKEISAYCRANNLPNISKTRIHIVNLKLADLIRDSEIIKKI